MKIIRKIFGDKYYEFFIHILRYLGIIPINYNINKDLNFGSLQANSYFKNELEKCSFYFEYGSGSSTILAKKLNKKFISIEGDYNFYRFMKKKVGEKVVYKSLGIVSFYCVPIILKYTNSISDKYKNKIISYCSENISNISKTGIDFPDLILVDGRFRVLTCFFLFKYLKDRNHKFKIIIDDFKGREYYHVLNKFFNIILVGRLGVVMSLKNNDYDLDNYINNYVKDWR